MFTALAQGLLQLGHETTPELAQLASVALYVYALAASPFRGTQSKLAVLAALQDWGDTWLLGDGSTSATTAPETAEAHRVAALVGTTVPPLVTDPLADAAYTVVYCYPGSALSGIDDVPGGAGCRIAF